MTIRLQSGHRSADRSFLDVLAGLAAVVALAVLLAGVPAALIAAFGLPMPHTVPSLSLLTHRLDLATVIRVCSVVVWLAWLQLVWCVAAEVTAAVRNTGMPARVPLAGGTQALAHRLVSSALLLTTATAISPAMMAAPSVTVAAASVLPGRPVALAGASTALAPGAAASLAVPGIGGGGFAAAPPATLPAAAPHGAGDVVDLLASVAARPAVAAGAHRTEKIYIVQPPEGRFHESLWEIAARHLGDGRRYREIFELNSGRVQPDGTELTIASLIRPGWILVMPADAHGQGIQVVTRSPHGPVLPDHTSPGSGSTTQPGTVHRPGTGHHGTGHQGTGHQGTGHQGAGHQGAGQPGTQQQGNGQAGHAPAGAGQHHAGQPRGEPGQPGSAAGPAVPAPRQPAPHRGASPPAPGRPAARSGAGQPTLPLELAGAGLLAAGVMAALAARRRRQQRQRAPGRRLALPPVRAAWAEAALRLGADEAAAGLLDTGLRHLGEALARDGRTPPTVFAAHIGDDSLDLWIAPPGYGAPDPWFAVGDGQVWRLPLAAAADLPARGAPAPYPALVTIGTDATGRVLVDMAAAPGLISVAGPGEPVGDALTAMATELATSRWSDGIGLTLVGFGADLAVLAPERVRMAATLAAALPGLEAWAAEAGEAIGPLNDSIPADRPAGVRAESWEPQYLITAVPPASAAERDRLLALARTCHAAGGGCLSAGEIPGAAWSWHITPDGRLHTGQLGLHVTAQVIPHEQQLAMTELFETADDLAGAALGAPVLDPALSRAATDPGTAQVEIRLLGPVAVRGATGPEPGSPGLATEIVVYLATHPGGVHPDLLTTMIWPRGVSPERREAVLGQVSAWLGTDEIGRPHLASDASGRLRLGSGVRVDWQAFGTLLALAGHAAQPHPDGRERLEETLLAEALSLVEGPFLGGPERDGYAWLAVDGLEHEVAARVADAAHRLCELQLAAGEPDGAMEAVQAGLRLAPEDELLWRDLIIAAHATGDDGLLRSVVAEICGWARVDDRVPGLAPETGALIDELLPGWRWPAG